MRNKKTKAIAIFLILTMFFSYIFFSCQKKENNNLINKLNSEIKEYNDNVINMLIMTLNNNKYSYRLELNNSIFFIAKQQFTEEEIKKIQYKDINKNEYNDSYLDLYNKYNKLINNEESVKSTLLISKEFTKLLFSNPFITLIKITKNNNNSYDIYLNQLIYKNEKIYTNIFGVKNVSKIEFKNFDKNDITELIKYIINKGIEDSFNNDKYEKEYVYFYNLIISLDSFIDFFLEMTFKTNNKQFKDFLKKERNKEKILDFIEQEYKMNENDKNDTIKQFIANTSLDIKNAHIEEKKLNFDIYVNTKYFNKKLKYFYGSIEYELLSTGIKMKELEYFKDSNKEQYRNINVFIISEYSRIFFNII